MNISGLGLLSLQGWNRHYRAQESFSAVNLYLYPKSCVHFLCPLHKILRDFSIVARGENAEGGIHIIKIGW